MMAFPTQSIWVIRAFKLISLEERMQHLGSKSSRSGWTAPKNESILARLQSVRSPVEVAKPRNFGACTLPVKEPAAGYLWSGWRGTERAHVPRGICLDGQSQLSPPLPFASNLRGGKRTSGIADIA
jgi:hypothetical protein